MQYKVIETKTIKELEDQVTKLLKGGYKLIGGVSATIDANSQTWYAQAVYTDRSKDEMSEKDRMDLMRQLNKD